MVSSYRVIRSWGCVLSLLLLPGCELIEVSNDTHWFYHGKSLPVDFIQEFVVGVTNQSQVERALGKPDTWDPTQTTATYLLTEQYHHRARVLLLIRYRQQGIGVGELTIRYEKNVIADVNLLTHSMQNTPKATSSGALRPP